MNLHAQAESRGGKAGPEAQGYLRGLGKSRLVGAALVLAALMLLAMGLFYPEENWRGKRAWEDYRRHLVARGVELHWQALAPAPARGGANLAVTRFFAPLFDYVPGTYTPRDLQAYNRVATFAQIEAPYLEARAPERVPAMVQGRKTDLAEAVRLVRKARGHPPPALPAGAPKEQTPEERRADAVALIQELGEFEPVLAELRVTTARPQAQFNLNYSEEYSWRVSQPHLPLLKRISRLLMWRGSAELAAQNPSAAAEDVGLLIALARVVGREPLNSSFAARKVLLEDALQLIWEGLADRSWSDEQLSGFEAALQEFTLEDVRPLLGVERAALNSYFEMVHKDPGILKEWNFGTSLGAKAEGFALRHMPAGWMYLEQMSYERLFDRFAAPAFQPENGIVRPRMVDRGGSPAFPLWGHELVAARLLKSAGFILTRAALIQTGVDEAIVACALERYRLARQQFPERLEELSSPFAGGVPADVITGGPLKYRRNADGGFLLYSVGRNETDDGGKVVLNPQTKAPETDQGDWVWPEYAGGKKLNGER